MLAWGLCHAGGPHPGGLQEAAAQDRRPADGDTLTAAEVVRRALAEAPEVRAAAQQVAAAAAAVRGARSDWFPDVRGEAGYRRLSGNVDYTVDFPSIPGTGGEPVTFAPAILDRYSARASVSQPVFTGFRRPSRVAAAKADARGARARVEAVRAEVAFRARSAYWQLYEARARRRAAADALRGLERRRVDVENRRAAGAATEADVLRVRARADRVRVDLIRARNDVRAARRRLGDWIGRPVGPAVALADTAIVAEAISDSVAGTPASLAARADRQRPELEELRQAVRAREADVTRARAGWYPEVALRGSYLFARPNEQLFPPEDRFEGSWEAGVTLSWSLAVGGRTRAATDQAEALLQAARHRLEDRRRDIALDVRQQADRVQAAREAVEAARTSAASAGEAFRSVQLRYDEGQAVVSDLLDAEQALREARARQAGAAADYALARAALDRALGRPPESPPEGQ